MVKGENIADAGFQYLGVPYSQMDCQAFVEKCLSDCGIHKDLRGSNAWYRECMKHGWVGSPEECVKEYGTVPTGTFLFILEHDGGEEKVGYHDGLGNASHIGIVTHKGKGALHSSQSKGCVCESEFHDKTIKNGGWNQVGLWLDEIDYGIDEYPDPRPKPEPEEPDMAIVIADNGKTVKMRLKPSTDCNMYWDVPIGSEVIVDEWDAKEDKKGNKWSKITWDNKMGYMMTKFLEPENEVEPEPDQGDKSNLYTVVIPFLPLYQADALLEKYPGAYKGVERG